MTEQAAKKGLNYQKVDGLNVSPCLYPGAIRDTVKFKPRKDDIILVTYPRCGTNWVQQITLLLRNKGKPSKDFATFMDECPELEWSGTECLDTMESPRFYRSHFPCNLLSYSSDAKYIWVVRNPKDCLISHYNITKSLFFDFDGDFNEFFDAFINDETDYGGYFNHILSWYEHLHDGNVLQLYYENLKNDRKGTIKQIATFLGAEYEEMIQDDTILNQIMAYSSFDYMKKTISDDPVNNVLWSSEVDIDSLPISDAMKHFHKYSRNKSRQPDSIAFELIRKGIVGDWKANFSEEQNELMNRKIDEKLRDTEFLKFWNENNYLLRF